MTELNLLLCVAYLLGSVSFAVLLARLRHQPDPRSFGSRNPGASNMLRLGNRRLALGTLLGDMGKGALAVWLASQAELEPVQQAWVGLAAVIGHILPLYHRFQGGKGVATAAGVLLALHPLLGLGTLLTWVIIAWFFRYSSLAALISAVFAPLWYLFLFRPDPILAAVTLMSLLLIWRHASNIQNLLAGKEGRIGGGKGEKGKEGKVEGGREKGKAGKR